VETLEQRRKSEHSHYLAERDVGDNREFQLPGSGLKCGHCGKILQKVHRTITTPGFVTRERICIECGKLNTTAERIINTRDRRGNFTSPCE